MKSSKSNGVLSGSGSSVVSSSGASNPPPDKRASSPISAIDISSGSSSTISSSGSSCSSNIERSGISIPAEASSGTLIGFKSDDKSGASKVGAGSELPVDAEGFARPAKSDRSSSTGAASISASICGIPNTKSSESFTSSTSFGIITCTGFSPRLARTVISSPRDRRSLLNCLS